MPNIGLFVDLVCLVGSLACFLYRVSPPDPTHFEDSFLKNGLTQNLHLTCILNKIAFENKVIELESHEL